MYKFNELRPEFPLLFIMPSLDSSTDKTVRFKDFSSHGSGSTNISKVRIGTPFPEWPLSVEIKGLEIEESTEHNLQVHVNGFVTKSLQLNDLLNLTIDSQ